MTQAEFEKIVKQSFLTFQKIVPNPKTRYVKYYVNAYGNVQRGSTGNLAFNALQHRFKALKKGFKAEIYINDKIAPYVYYTNERWLSPKWNGHPNPNEGWVKKGVNEIVDLIVASTHGSKSKWEKITGVKK